MNRKLTKGKKIKFYGTNDDSLSGAAPAGVNFFQDSDFVTKVELNKMLDAHKTDFRN